MKIKNIDVSKSIEKARNFISGNKSLTPETKAMFELLLLIISFFVGHHSLNSKNSSKPPSSDPNRKKKSKKNANGKKPGGQFGRIGKTLEPFANPDKIIEIKVDRSQLVKGEEYVITGYEARQIVDIKISRVVTEYRAQILKSKSTGKSYTANFPDGINRQVQYGQNIKSHSVYMSQYQLLPYDRIQDYFADQMGIPISVGSIFNFNKEAYERLEVFSEIAKRKLQQADLVHADETGINIGSKLVWLHSASNLNWVYFYPHQVRGNKAMNEIGILPNFTGILCHDHWKAYYSYTNCKHALCNAHHLRELKAVEEINKHRWAKDLQDLLCRINKEKQENKPENETENKTKNENGRALTKEAALHYRLEYRRILKEGEKESKEPPPAFNKSGSIRKNPKKEKHRNLLERLKHFEDDALRFMEIDFVPFTNNVGENDLRMTKVQQKISGCFRSMGGAKIFCRVRGYLKTCQKQDVPPTKALALLFSGKLPDFCGV